MIQGRFSYQNAIGPARPNEPITLSATFLMASCTKLLTSIAGIQCVERGQIGLDDDVSSVLTELKDAEILIGFEEETGKPILKNAANKITLRLVSVLSATISTHFNDTLLEISLHTHLVSVMTFWTLDIEGGASFVGNPWMACR